jgi:hypothetical protein
MSPKNLNTRILFNLCGGPSPSPSASTGPRGVPDVEKPLELHGCAGLNACKGHDRFGTNDCAGMGYCSTTTHVCHTLNDCRGQGGCGLYGSAEEQCNPSNNDCAFLGSCATPIQEERFSTLGPNAGKSVWLLARNIFEERMAKSNRKPGASPFPAGPPQAWLMSLGEYDSCGSSGNKSCSFGFNNPATNTDDRVRRSLETMAETRKECGCLPNDESPCGCDKKKPASKNVVQ